MNAYLPAHIWSCLPEDCNRTVSSFTGLFLMLIFGFWFVTEVSCQIVYGDIDRVFHIEENIRKMRDAELEAALKEDYADDDTPEE